MSRTDLASERKTHIIKATIQCITQYGYHNFSMQDVAKIAEISKGIIHYYFLNKEDLLTAVLNYVNANIENLLCSNQKNLKPTVRLSHIIRLCSEVVQKKREYYRINMDFWTQIDQKKKIRNELAQHYDKFRNSFALVIQQGMQQGDFRTGNSKQFASIIIAMIDGIALQWLFDDSAFSYTEIMKNCEEAIMGFLANKNSEEFKSDL
jgi:TetR/AcrR family fatty acid metabolism transcriptional regulator